MQQTEVRDTENLRNAKEQIQVLQKRLLEFLTTGAQIQISSKDYMACYQQVFKIDFKDPREEESMFNWYSQQLTEYVQTFFVNNLINKEEEPFLDILIKEWESYKLYLFWWQFIIKAFDKKYESTKQVHFFGRAMEILREQVFDKALLNKLREILNTFIEKERDNFIVPKDKILKAISYLVDLGYGNRADLIKFTEKGFSQFVWRGKEGTQNYEYYRNNFETFLCHKTQEFYKMRAQNWLPLTSDQYVQNSLQSIKKENTRVSEYFPQSREVYFKVIDHELVTENCKTIVHNEATGILKVLAADKKEILADFYELLKRVPDPNLSILAERVLQYIKNKGNELNSDQALGKDPLKYTQEVLNLKATIDGYVIKQLGNQVIFQNSRDNAFKHFINNFEKFPKFLAAYCDNEMRQKTTSEDEITKKIQDIIGVFVYLYSRDEYIAAYQKYLEIRLLGNKSASEDYEKKLIAALQQEVGANTVNKLQSMMNDVKSSHEISVDYVQYLKTNHPSISEKVKDIQLQVLTKASWNIKEEVNIILPDELKETTKIFKEYYNIKFPGRVLEWAYSQGTSEAIARINKKAFNLTVTNYQLFIVLHFNAIPNMSIQYKKLQEMTHIPEKELQVALKALFKVDLVQRSNQEAKEEFDENEIVSINQGFNPKNRVVRCLPTRDAVKTQQMATANKTEEEENEINKARENIVDACVVRIMKSRNIATQNEVIQETMKLINLFKPDIKLIRRRIESLMEREYMKRDANDRQKFIYIP